MVLAPKRWIGLRLRLARGAARCHSDRHSHPPNPGRGKTRPFPRWRWRDAVFEDRFGQSPGSIKFAEPRSDTALPFYPSREQQWPIHLRHQVCAAKQRQGRAVIQRWSKKAAIHFLCPFPGVRVRRAKEINSPHILLFLHRAGCEDERSSSTGPAPYLRHEGVRAFGAKPVGLVGDRTRKFNCEL